MSCGCRSDWNGRGIIYGVSCFSRNQLHGSEDFTIQHTITQLQLLKRIVQTTIHFLKLLLYMCLSTTALLPKVNQKVRNATAPKYHFVSTRKPKKTHTMVTTDTKLLSLFLWGPMQEETIKELRRLVSILLRFHVLVVLNLQDHPNDVVGSATPSLDDSANPPHFCLIPPPPLLFGPASWHPVWSCRASL